MQANDDSTELRVEIKSIRVDLNDVGAEIYPEPVEAVIDSTLPYLYLPPKLCDWFAAKYSLAYDGEPSEGNTGVYGTNASQDNDNFLNTKSITFALAQPGGSELTSIDFTYNSFSALASWSWGYPDAQPIFLIRKTQDSGNTAVLGRAFFQQAYVSANYENTTGTGKTFNVSQAAFPDTQKAHIISIIGERPAGSNGGNEISGGAIAGIVIGAVAALVIAGLFAWFCFFKKQRDRKREAQKARDKPIVDGNDPTSMEAVSPRPTYETRTRASSTWSDLTATPSEIEGRPRHSRQISELSSDSDHARPTPLLDTLHEMPDKSDAGRLERYVGEHKRSRAEAGELEGSTQWLHPDPPRSPDPMSPSSIYSSQTPVQESSPAPLDFHDPPSPP
jgi:hypothetical protein